MLAAYGGSMSILDKHWHHDPQLTNNNRQTVAMIVAKYRWINELKANWYHFPALKDHEGNTVAMLIAKNGGVFNHV